MRGVEEILEQRTRIDSQWKECDTAPVRLFTHSDRIDRDHRASHSARSLIRRSATKQGPTTSNTTTTSTTNLILLLLLSHTTSTTSLPQGAGTVAQDVPNGLGMGGLSLLVDDNGGNVNNPQLNGPQNILVRYHFPYQSN